MGSYRLTAGRDTAEQGILDFLYRIIADSQEDFEALPVLNPTTDLSDLSLSSIKFLQLIFELENRFNVELQEHRLIGAETLDDLADTVAEARQHKLSVRRRTYTRVGPGHSILPRQA